MKLNYLRVYAWVLASITMCVLQGQGQPLHEYGMFAVFQDQEAEIFLNGFPFHAATQDMGASRSEIITRFLKTGANEVRITSTDLFTAENEKISGFFRFRFEERILGAEDPTTVSQLDRQCDPDLDDASVRTETYTLATRSDFNFENESTLTMQASTLSVDTSSEQATYGHASGATENVAILHVDLPNAPVPSLPWLSTPVALDAVGEAEIRQLISDAHDGFVQSDADGIVALLDKKVERTALAMDKTEPQIAAILRDFYEQQVFTIPNLVFDDLDLEAIAFVEYAGLNLVQAVIDDGPPITGSGDDTNFSMKVFLSNFEGSWMIVE